MTQETKDALYEISNQYLEVLGGALRAANSEDISDDYIEGLKSAQRLFLRVVVSVVSEGDEQ